MKKKSSSNDTQLGAAQEDISCWQRYAEYVKPLKKKPIHREVSVEKPLPLPELNPKRHVSESAINCAVAPKTTTIKAFKMPRIPIAYDGPDSEIKKRLKQAKKVDATLDLHGLTQAFALPKIEHFIKASCLRNHRLVLIVTGKGHKGGRAEESGVLKKNLPHWLMGSTLAPYVISFSPALPHHGGSGAFYVRLRAAHKVD